MPLKTAVLDVLPGTEEIQLAFVPKIPRFTPSSSCCTFDLHISRACLPSLLCITACVLLTDLLAAICTVLSLLKPRGTLRW